MDYIYMTSMAAVREASILGVDSAPTSRAQDLSKGGMGVARLFFFKPPFDMYGNSRSGNSYMEI